MARGLSCSEIARRSGLHDSTVWHVFHGSTVSPKFSTAEAILVALDAGDIEVGEQRQRTAVPKRFQSRMKRPDDSLYVVYFGFDTMEEALAR